MSAPRGPRGGTAAGRSRPSSSTGHRIRGSARGVTSSPLAETTRGRERGNASVTNSKAEGLFHGLQAGNLNKRGDATSSRGANRGVSRTAGSRKAPTSRRPTVNSLHRGAISNSRAMRSAALKPENYPAYNEFLNAVETRYTELKAKRATDRTEAIQKGFLADPDKKVTLDQAITPVGTCTDMCPEFERLERMKQSMVDSAEKASYNPWDRDVPAEERMVKRFRRSAAGYDEQLPSDIRTPATLKMTLDYLFDEVVGKAESFAAVQKFVWDRTRSIRNDFSIQQVTEEKDVALAVECFERIARFHIISLHQLSNPEALAGQEYFDAHQEREQLNNTLLSLMYYYDDHRERIPFKNEAEFRAYCIIFEIQSQHPDLEDRMQSWPKPLLGDMRVQTAFKLYSAAGSTLYDQGPLKPPTPFSIARGNSGGFWRLLSSSAVSYLMACVGEIYFGQVRYVALQNIWKNAKSSPSTRQGTEEWSIAELTKALAFDEDDETIEFVEGFDLSFKSNAQGVQYLDFTCQPSAVLERSPVVNKQVFSSLLVEKKRMRRTLNAVMNGLTVAQAVREGAVITESDVDVQAEMTNTSGIIQESEESMFVPETGNAFGPGARSSKPLSIFNPQAPSFNPISKPLSAPLGQAAGTSSIFGQPAPSTSSTIFGKPFSPQPEAGLLNASSSATDLQPQSRSPSPTPNSNPFSVSGLPSKSSPSPIFGSPANQSSKDSVSGEQSPPKATFSGARNLSQPASQVFPQQEPSSSVPPNTPRPSHAEIPAASSSRPLPVFSFDAPPTSSTSGNVSSQDLGRSSSNAGRQGQIFNLQQDSSKTKSIFDRTEAGPASSDTAFKPFQTTINDEPQNAVSGIAQPLFAFPTSSQPNSGLTDSTSPGFGVNGNAHNTTAVHGSLFSANDKQSSPSNVQNLGATPRETAEVQPPQPIAQKPFPDFSALNQAPTSPSRTQRPRSIFQAPDQIHNVSSQVQNSFSKSDATFPSKSLPNGEQSERDSKNSSQTSAVNSVATPPSVASEIADLRKETEKQTVLVAQKEAEVKIQKQAITYCRAKVHNAAQLVHNKAREKERIARQIRHEQAEVARLREYSKSQRHGNSNQHADILKELDIAVRGFTDTANLQKEKVLDYENGVSQKEQEEAALRAEETILTSLKLDLETLQSGLRSQNSKIKQNDSKIGANEQTLNEKAGNANTSSSAQARIEQLTEQALNNLSHTAVTEAHGILQQFVEFASGDLIRDALETYRQDQMLEKAKPYREHILKHKYGKRWHSLWWKRNMLRKGQNSRAKMNALRRSIREEEKHRAKIEAEQNRIAIEAKISEGFKRQIRENDEQVKRERRQTLKDREGTDLGNGVPVATRASLTSPSGRKRKSPDIDDIDDIDNGDSWENYDPLGQRQIIKRSISHKRTRTLPTSTPITINRVDSRPQVASTPDGVFRASATSNSSPQNATSSKASNSGPRWTPQEGWRKREPETRKSVNRTHTDYFRLKARNIDPETPFVPDTQKTIEVKNSRLAQQDREEELNNFASSLNRGRKDTLVAANGVTSTTPKAIAAPSQTKEIPDSVKRANALLESFKKINSQIDEATKDLRETNIELRAQQEVEHRARQSIPSYHSPYDQSPSSNYSSERSFTPGQTTNVNGYAFTPGRSLSRSEARLRMSGGSGLAYRDPTEFEAEIKQLQMRQKQVLKQHKPLTMDEVDRKHGLGKYAPGYVSKGNETPEHQSEPEALSEGDEAAPDTIASLGSIGQKRKRASAAIISHPSGTGRRRRKKGRSLDGPYVYESDEDEDNVNDEGEDVGQLDGRRLREVGDELLDLSSSSFGPKFVTSYGGANGFDVEDSLGDEVQTLSGQYEGEEGPFRGNFDDEVPGYEEAVGADPDVDADADEDADGYDEDGAYHRDPRLAMEQGLSQGQWEAGEEPEEYYEDDEGEGEEDSLGNGEYDEEDDEEDDDEVVDDDGEGYDEGYDEDDEGAVGAGNGLTFEAATAEGPGATQDDAIELSD